MRSLYFIVGALMIVVGMVALISGDFTADGTWVLALALAAVGAAGLISTLATAISDR